MEFLDAVFKWLRLFPELRQLQVDQLAPEPGSCGLFFQGERQIRHARSITGEDLSRCQSIFLLRRRLPRGANAARWLLAFQDDVRRQNLEGNSPRIGVDPQVRVEKARMVAGHEADAATYEVEIVFTYQHSH